MSQLPSSVALFAALMVLSAAAKAQSMHENEALTRAIGASVETAVSPGWSGDPNRPTLDTGIWLSHRNASIGLALTSPIDVVLPHPTLSPLHGGAAPTSMLMGVRYDVGARSRLYVDTLATARDVRMGFEFKPAPSQALAIARGTLFRVQWSSNSQLSLRLRGGGLTVALRSQF
jgi:hypothetical protein